VDEIFNLLGASAELRRYPPMRANPQAAGDYIAGISK
jgi:hypothetical protein